MAISVNVLTYADALAAGFLSFASPCALALVPGYLSFVSGASFDEMSGQATLTMRASTVARATVAFIAGFAAMFSIFGASAGLLGHSLQADRDTLNLISGALLILLGIAMIFLPRLGLLQSERRIGLGARPTTLMGIGLAGAAFAVAWVPCTGPFLGQVLTLALPTESPGLGATLLFTYALGLGIPFLLAGLFLTQTISFSRRVRDHWRTVNIAAATGTIVLGTLIATGRFTTITASFQSLGVGR
jgi:cytochrome c-type biogenesis protein